ncbi:lipolytic protein G-D-S-L family [Cellulophaga algicola DSM 14237]|uniref:Lipolytic protein G-D-S-L family n=1 Tax=Cellulophaga algicola (strain DSM 14237 / IC166 / ACAM 630) TaxID=688270 RepID=E6XCX1_CELAD|nr:SGNH/GDSL hydrolase family protein [Cellulophaga algicola]ADV50112.1 lipolytic protein G-D-S-L family [Cellulophaga algicola DSM 14237]
MNLNYILGAIITIPLLPLLYFQGKKIKKNVPRLPEARGPKGITSIASKKVLRMLTIGESTIAGVGVATHQEGFTGNLANELAIALQTNIEWKVYAKSGYTAKQVCDKIIGTITEKSIDIIVIGLGGNDAFELNSPKKWNRDIRTLIKSIQLKFKGVPVVFTNMPPIKEFPAFTALIKFIIGNLVTILGNELEKVVKNFDNVYYYTRPVSSVDLINRYNLNIHSSNFFSDGVHPSKTTYQIWAKDISNFILESPDIKIALQR